MDGALKSRADVFFVAASHRSEGLPNFSNCGDWMWSVLVAKSCKVHKLLKSDLYFIELDDGKIYRKPLYLMVKTMVSCRFCLKPIHWLLDIASFKSWVGFVQLRGVDPVPPPIHIQSFCISSIRWSGRQPCTLDCGRSLSSNSQVPLHAPRLILSLLHVHPFLLASRISISPLEDYATSRCGKGQSCEWGALGSGNEGIRRGSLPKLVHLPIESTCDTFSGWVEPNSTP
jgi:hypothetical protein